jgi:hypothetical protein
MNRLDSTLLVLGAGVAIGGAVYTASRFFGVRRRIVAEQRRVRYVDRLSRIVPTREGIPRELRRRAVDPVLREVPLQ